MNLYLPLDQQLLFAVSFRFYSSISVLMSSPSYLCSAIGGFVTGAQIEKLFMPSLIIIFILFNAGSTLPDRFRDETLKPYIEHQGIEPDTLCKCGRRDHLNHVQSYKYLQLKSQVKAVSKCRQDESCSIDLCRRSVSTVVLPLLTKTSHQ